MTDGGPIDLAGNIVDTGDTDVESERVRSTTEMFVWRNGAEILEKHEEVLRKIFSDDNNGVETDGKNLHHWSCLERAVIRL